MANPELNSFHGGVDNDFSALVQQSSAAIIGLTVDGHVRTWNAAAERLFEFSLDQMWGKHISLLVPDALRSEQEAALERLRRGEPVRLDTVRLNRSGERLGIHMSAAPIRDGKGAIVGISAILLNAAELHGQDRAQEGFGRRQAFLLDLADRLRCVSDPREIQLIACRMLAEQLHVARVQYAEYDAKNDALSVEQEYHGSMPSTAGRWPLEELGKQVAHSLRAGVTIAMSDVKTDPLLDPKTREAYARQQIAACVGVPLVREGRLLLVLSALDVIPRDWTRDDIGLLEDAVERTTEAVERGRAEARLKASEDRLRSSLHIETVGVIFFGFDGPIYESNAAFQRMSGYSAEEVQTGKLTWQTMTPPEFHDVSENAIREVSVRGYTTPYEKQYIRKDGSRWWGLFAARRLPDGTGVEYIIDVTERRQLENSLRDADRRKDEFLATLGHELRNPLAPIRNGLQILRLAGRHDQTMSGTIDMMDRQVKHLVHLVDDLLDLGRITAGKIELRRQRVHLKELVLASVEATRVFVDAHRLDLTLDLPDQDIALDADPERMTQVIANMLSNAAKYTDPGGKIILRASIDNGKAIVTVTDTGIGIPTDELEHVFDLFSQVRTHQGRSEGGLGIGLSLVKSLVTMHGGTVRAFSNGPGTGSTFTVELPLAKSEQDSVRASSVADRECNSGSRTILVVDDNMDSAQSLAALLSLDGHRTLTAYDGEEAIQKVSAVQPDTVILDLGMPKMNGLDAARKIRDLPDGQRITLVALTGWGQENDRRRTREAGFDHHFVKPLDLQALGAILKKRPPPEATHPARGRIVGTEVSSS